MALHEINIAVTVNGNFTYTPATLRVRAGAVPPPADQIRWTCEHPFTLMFQSGTPIKQMEVFNLKGGQTDSYPIDSDAVGHYPYAVAVAVAQDGETRVFIDSNCPVIICN